MCTRRTINRGARSAVGFLNDLNTRRMDGTAPVTSNNNTNATKILFKNDIVFSVSDIFFKNSFYNAESIFRLTSSIVLF